MYCIEALIKHKRYFEFLKANKSDIFSLTFDDVAQTSKSGFESISKLRSSVLERLNSGFDQSEKQGGNVFDVSKLEALKQQGNKNFFEKMQEIKKGKPVAEPKESHSQSNTDANNFLDLDFGSQPAQVKKNPVAQSQSNAYGDLLDFNPIPPSKHTPQVQSSNKGGSDFDLLNDFSSNLNIKPQPNKSIGSDNLLDLTGTIPVQSLNQQHNYSFGNSGFEVNFDSRQIVPKMNESSPGTDFSNMNFGLLTSAHDKAKNAKKDKDPFDFIVF